MITPTFFENKVVAYQKNGWLQPKRAYFTTQPIGFLCRGLARLGGALVGLLIH